MKSGFGPLGALFLLAACGSDVAKPAVPPDPSMEQHERAGQLAYSLDRPEDAVAQYREALIRAEARDDLAAIGDLSFNLAAAQLRANQPDTALATARRARAELARRGSPGMPALDLIEATALYRIGKMAEADRLAAQLQHRDPETGASASFLRGLIADDRGDLAGLQAASQVLSRTAAGSEKAPVVRSTQQADAAELRARLARRQGNFSEARSAALQSADLRRDLLDYRGLARALSVAADAAQRQGDLPAAADLYLRAGRSAAAQDDRRQARAWLDHAIDLDQDAEITEAARQALKGIREAGTD
ncbi:hypothetical protein ACFPL7_23930 [Dongia soli]|uniref:Tetratricopeptide repeat protein n=1 Tax=Dongia soli TaxID=600628 RepID=A0ABU5EGJ9_9PROT|nr:hypothetical protein [Dongia soli]MDY0885353.1 hypothetical protein [Dongia soli]